MASGPQHGSAGLAGASGAGGGGRDRVGDEKEARDARGKGEHGAVDPELAEYHEDVCERLEELAAVVDVLADVHGCGVEARVPAGGGHRMGLGCKVFLRPQRPIGANVRA